MIDIMLHGINWSHHGHRQTKSEATGLLVRNALDALTNALPGEAKGYIKKMVMGPAFEEIGSLITNSRPPVLMLIGRSGHGKSSVINALANKTVAAVNGVKPCTPYSEQYEIAFTERFAAWTVIDTRGILESTTPQGGLLGDAVDILKHDVREYRPDVIMHVISMPEIRALANDLRVFKEIMGEIKSATGAEIPTMVVLNKADTFGRPGAWPPEEHAGKAALIAEALDYMAGEVLQVASSHGL